MLQDLRHAARLLLRAKAWTAVVLVSLALGIGANIALFGAINGLFLDKLNVSDPDTLVRLRHANTGRNDMVTNSSDYGYSAPGPDGLQVRATFSYPMYQRLVAENRTLTALIACAPIGRVNVVVDGRAEIATALISSGNFYQVLGVTARVGRTILPEDDDRTAPPIAVISHRYWQSRFGADANVVGRSIRINNVPVTIVGVLGPEFAGVQRTLAAPPDVAIPLALDGQLAQGQQRMSQPTHWWLQVMGRLRPGATAEAVEANFATIFQQTARAGLDSYLASLPPDERSRSYNQNLTQVPRLRVDSGARGVYDVNRNDVRAVSVLSGMVVLLLLIVCANVANLLLSRALSRQKEISVRLSLGASRLRLVRQLLTESLLLAAIGGAIGTLVGYWGQQLLPGAAAQGTVLDTRVFAFVIAVTTATGVLFGIAPALRTTGDAAGAALKEQSRSVSASRTLLSKSLLIVQVAISLMLLIGAGLFLQTLQNLRRIDVGFNPRNLAVFRVNPALNRYDDKKIPVLYESMIDRFRTVAGVQSAALSHMALLTGGSNTTNIFVDGRQYAGNEGEGMHRLIVSPGFFETMEMPLTRGRGFTPSDHESAPKVAVINEAAARRHFANEDPLGRRFGSNLEVRRDFEIVGVVRDAFYDNLRNPVPPTMYVSFRQNRTPSAVFEVRTLGDPASVVGSLRETIRQIDPTLPMTDVTTQAEQIEGRLVQERVFAQAYSLFGGVALLLASIGLFGVMSYSVARRTNEIGIRMALGAPAQRVLRMVMRESMLLVVIGIAIGLAAAIAAGRLIASQLFGLAPTDVTTMVAGTAVMAVVAAVAGYLPARRASKVDPMVALRCE